MKKAGFVLESWLASRGTAVYEWMDVAGFRRW